jgi:hypothetical protein
MGKDQGGTKPEDSNTERDFGDSAGYGSGGSAKDYHEVGDDEADPVKDRPNPLDEVVKIKNPVSR